MDVAPTNAATGRTVLLAFSDGTARLFDVRTGRQALPLFAHAAPPSSVALSGDGTRLMTFDGRALRVWDTTGGEPASPGGCGWIAATPSACRTPAGPSAR